MYRTDSTGGLLSLVFIDATSVSGEIRVYLPAILARQGVGSRGECSEIREYATSPGCSVDVMHGGGSLLRHNIRGDIVYCYPSNDFNGIKNFNGVKKFRYAILCRSWRRANDGTSIGQAGNPGGFIRSLRDLEKRPK